MAKRATFAEALALVAGEVARPQRASGVKGRGSGWRPARPGSTGGGNQSLRRGSQGGDGALQGPVVLLRLSFWRLGSAVRRVKGGTSGPEGDTSKGGADLPRPRPPPGSGGV